MERQEPGYVDLELITKNFRVVGVFPTVPVEAFGQRGPDFYFRKFLLVIV